MRGGGTEGTRCFLSPCPVLGGHLVLSRSHPPSFCRDRILLRLLLLLWEDQKSSRMTEIPHIAKCASVDRNPKGFGTGTWLLQVTTRVEDHGRRTRPHHQPISERSKERMDGYEARMDGRVFVPVSLTPCFVGSFLVGVSVLLLHRPPFLRSINTCTALPPGGMGDPKVRCFFFRRNWGGVSFRKTSINIASFFFFFFSGKTKQVPNGQDPTHCKMCVHRLGPLCDRAWNLVASCSAMHIPRVTTTCMSCK